MSSLYLCNTSSDYISKVNLAMFKEETRIPMGMDKSSRVGPSGICAYKDKLLVANSYSNTLSIIDVQEEIETGNFFIGAHCSGVRVFKDNAYVICGELNSVIVFNLIKKKVTEKIPCGDFPYSISMDEVRGLAVVSNIRSDSITLIDCKNSESVVNIKVSAYPTNAVFDTSGKYILVCESNMGIKTNGNLKIIDVKSLKPLTNIIVGNSPLGICCDSSSCYISNFGDGTISIIDLVKFKEIKRIRVGGMPRDIIKDGKYIYFGDNSNNLLVQLDAEKGSKKVITVGAEPTAMTIC